MGLTKISNLEMNQKVWFFTKYGDLLGGKISELEPNVDYGSDVGVKDAVTINVDSGDKKEDYWHLCKIFSDNIYTTKPNQSEFVSNEVSVEMECECGGTIRGTGFANSDGVVQSYNYLECGSCDWDQAS